MWLWFLKREMLHVAPLTQSSKHQDEVKSEWKNTGTRLCWPMLIYIVCRQCVNNPKHLTNEYTRHRGMNRYAQPLQQNKLETWGGGHAYRALCPALVFAFLVCQCFPTSLRRARNQRGSADRRGRTPAPDRVWGAWGGQPAQQQLTRKQIKQATSGLSHLPASHVGGPPCPSSLSFMHKDGERRDS